MQCDISATNLGVHCINLATIVGSWNSQNVFMTWFYVYFSMQVGGGNSKVLNISTHTLSNSPIMEFSLVDEKP